MPKNLDGARKLNPDEINENRRIVLRYIGEKDTALTKKERNHDVRVLPSSMRVDGIKMKLKPSVRIEEKIMPDKAAFEKSAKKQADEKAKIESERKMLAEKEEKRMEKLKFKENKRLEKIKRAEEIKKIKSEIKAEKTQAAKKKNIKRKKAIKIFKNKLKNKLKFFFSFFRRIFLYSALYLIVVLIIFYSIFCVIVLRFKIETGIITKIERVLPVPAAVSSRGIINYHDFLGAKNNNYNNLNLAGKKAVLAKWMVLKKLSDKYGLAADSPKEILAQAFAADEDFNREELARIKKISESLKDAKNPDDIKQFGKYADEYGESVYNADSAARKFGQAIFNLKIDEISEAFFGDSGYYIAQVYDNKNGELGIKYFFVGAKTLDQYVSEQSAQIKLFILAN